MIERAGGLLKRFFSTGPIPTSVNPLRPRYNQPYQDPSSIPQVLIQCLPNNIFATVTESPGRIMFKLSSGLIGMKNAAKTSPKAAMALIDNLSAKLKQNGIQSIRLNFRGLNSARPLIVSQLRKVDMKITEVVDSTGIPFNGCRPKKKRRV